MRDKKGADVNGMGGGEELRRREGSETYYVRENLSLIKGKIKINILILNDFTKPEDGI